MINDISDQKAEVAGASLPRLLTTPEGQVIKLRRPRPIRINDDATTSYFERLDDSLMIWGLHKTNATGTWRASAGW